MVFRRPHLHLGYKQSDALILFLLVVPWSVCLLGLKALLPAHLYFFLWVLPADSFWRQLERLKRSLQSMCLSECFLSLNLQFAPFLVFYLLLTHVPDSSSFPSFQSFSCQLLEHKKSTFQLGISFLCAPHLRLLRAAAVLQRSKGLANYL